VNEGKTLTQISEENMYGIGEDRGDEFEDKQAQVYDQVVPVESKEADESVSDDKKESTSIISEMEQALKSADVVKGGSDYQSNKEPSESDMHRTAVNNEIDPKKAEPEGEEQPLNPTVKGNSDGLEGDYDIFLNLCFKPGICSCSSCTNISTDVAAAAASNTNECEEVAEDIFGDTARNPDATCLTDTNVAGNPDDIEWPGIETNIQGSVSSRTLESEKDGPKEDSFSPANGQTFLGSSDDRTDIQHDEEDFELEEHNHSNVGLEMDDGLLDEPEHQNDHDDLDQGHAAPSSTFSLGNDIGAGGRSYGVNQDGAHAEADDELLNFDDLEEVQGEEDEKQRTSLSTHPQVAGDEITNGTSALERAVNFHDVTTTPHNEILGPKGDLLSTTLEPRQIQSPIGQSNDDTSTETAGDPPTTPSGSKNGFKRKAVEDEDEFDLFDTATPDKKRRRPS
jgi:hypothetical protein